MNAKRSVISPSYAKPGGRRILIPAGEVCKGGRKARESDCPLDSMTFARFACGVSAFAPAFARVI